MAAAEGRPKLTRGRQKIEIKLLGNEEDRLITFTKRRSGIYKKACELSTLCGAEVALIILSPAGKPFAFAHPSMESVTGKVLDKKPLIPSNSANAIAEVKRKMKVGELNHQYNELLIQLEAEKEREKSLQKTKDLHGESHGWWDAPIEELGLDELQQRSDSLTRLFEKVVTVLKGRDDTETAAPTFSTSFSSFSAIDDDQEINYDETASPLV